MKDQNFTFMFVAYNRNFPWRAWKDFRIFFDKTWCLYLYDLNLDGMKM